MQTYIAKPEVMYYNVLKLVIHVTIIRVLTHHENGWYRDSAGNNVDENSSILPAARMCGQ